MNNREAITLLRNLEDSLDSYCELNEEGKTAFRMAIEALNCSEFPNNSDTISRQAAIDALGEDALWDSDDEYETGMHTQWSMDVDAIKALPSVQPDYKDGWIYTGKKAWEFEPCEDTISRQAAIDALNGLIDRFEQILRDIRETNVDDSVCGMCEYDGAYIGQSGDWCNECPGFDKDDCFKLSDECRKRWLKSVNLPAVQPEPKPDKNGSEPFGNAEMLSDRTTDDCISRKAAIDEVINLWADKPFGNPALVEIKDCIEKLPSAQPDEEKISDILYNIYRNTSPHTSAEGVAATKYYIREIYREIYGEEGPGWMKK